MKKIWKRIFPTKEMREYNTMHKRHQEAMIKLAEEDQDWDYDFLHRLVVTKIKHMYEYYSAGMVLQSEESLNKVLETLKHTIDLADKIDNAAIYEESELYKEFYYYIGENITWWWD